MSHSSSGNSNSSSSDSLYDLIEQVTQRLQRGEPVDISELLAAHPQQAERLRQVLPAVEILADLHGTAAARGAAGDSTRPEHNAVVGILGDFRIVREIGRGGMGVVYEARQISLDRRVALKVLPFAGVLDSRQLQRFKNEARAAAGLHHQNIVPVYAVGCERGVHFYVMQYIEGQTLADVIRQLRRPSPSSILDPRSSNFHSPSATSPDKPTHPASALHPRVDTPRPPVTPGSPTNTRDAHKLRFRTIAEWGIQAAEALDYAHSVGVVHRDIKPANLMLDTDGRIWIADFGLAQIETDAGLTMTGDIVGTLRYMSPEQALGERGLIDQRSDAYSLGLVLYELLTLRPAFGEGNRREILHRISNDEPTPPRRINLAIPVELEIIVQKATEKDPVARYATARDLADDLRRFLQEQPIKARPATPLDRLRKWSRRNRSIVTSGIAVLAVSVVVLAFSMVWVTRERDNARDAERRERDQAIAARIAEQAARDQAVIASQQRNHAETAQQLAETRRRESQDVLNAARDVVENMLNKVGAGLMNQPQMEPVRKEILENAMAFYERFVGDDSGDLKSRLEKGRAYRRMGWIRVHWKRQPVEGLAMFRKALFVHEELFREFPDDPVVGEEFADSLGAFAVELNRVQKLTEAAEYADRAYDVSRALVRKFPESRQLRVLLASQSGLVSYFSALERPGHKADFERALELIRDSCRILEDLVREEPDYHKHYTNLSVAYAHGQLLLATGHSLDEAEAALRQGCNFARETVVRFPSKHECDDTLSIILTRLADFLADRRADFDQAEPAYREAVEIHRRLSVGFPLRYTVKFAISAGWLARALKRRGKSDEAIVVFREAIAAYKVCVELTGRTEGAQCQCAFEQVELAKWLASLGRHHDSVPLLQEAISTYKDVMTGAPGVLFHSHNLAGSYSLLGRTLLRAGRPADAEAAIRQALAVRRQGFELPDVAASNDYGRSTQTTDPLSLRYDNPPDQRWCFAQESLELAELLHTLARADDVQELLRVAMPFAEAFSAAWPQQQDAQQLQGRLRSLRAE